MSDTTASGEGDSDDGMGDLDDAGETLAPGGVPGAAGLGGDGVRTGVLSDGDERDDEVPADDVSTDTDHAADGDDLEGTTGGLT